MSSSTTNLNLLTVGMAQKEFAANALFDAASPATLYGRNANTCAGLVWGFYGGYANTTTGLVNVANNTVTCTANTTTYIEADPSSGAVSANTTGFTAGKIPLYQLTVGSSTITAYTDYRIANHRIFRNASKSVAGGADVTLSQSESANELLEVNGALTANINVVLPAYPFVWHVFNNTSGAYTVTFKTASGTGILVGQGKRAILACDGVNIVRFGADI